MIRITNEMNCFVLYKSWIVRYLQYCSLCIAHLGSRSSLPKFFFLVKAIWQRFHNRKLATGSNNELAFQLVKSTCPSFNKNIQALSLKAHLSMDLINSSCKRQGCKAKQHQPNPIQSHQSEKTSNLHKLQSIYLLHQSTSSSYNLAITFTMYTFYFKKSGVMLISLTSWVITKAIKSNKLKCST